MLIVVHKVCSRVHNFGVQVARLLRKLSLLNADGLRVTTELPGSGSDESTVANDTPLMPADYSRLFGEEYRVTDDDSLDLGSASTLDISIVEEALLHLLYACASQVCFLLLVLMSFLDIVARALYYN